MERIIKDQISRLENISKFMEMGSSMFTTCFAFDCFAQAVSHEIFYACSDFEVTIEQLKDEGAIGILAYIDYGENWLEWRDKFKKYAHFQDGTGISITGKWSRWTDKKLHSDKILTKEINTAYPDGQFHKITDYRDKYELRSKLDVLAKYMLEMHNLTKLLNSEIAIKYYETKNYEFLIYNKKAITLEVEQSLSYVPFFHLRKNTDGLIWEENNNLSRSGFDRFLYEGWDIDRYFYPNGVLDKETAGMYLAKYTKELTSEQKEAFFKYVLVREKVEQFVKNKTENNTSNTARQLSHADRVIKAIEATHTQFRLKKKEFSLLYIVMKTTIDDKCSIKKTMGFINNTNIPSDQKPSESSLKALTTNKKYPDWKIIDSSSDEMKRYNKIAKFFLDKYEKMTI